MNILRDGSADVVLQRIKRRHAELMRRLDHFSKAVKQFEAETKPAERGVGFEVLTEELDDIQKRLTDLEKNLEDFKTYRPRECSFIV